MCEGIPVCYHVLEHIKHDRNAMSELDRVLKRGGRATIMQQKVIESIRRFLPLYRFANLFYQFLLSSKSSLFFMKSWVFDPPNIKNKWNREIKKTQIDERKPLYFDRQSEVKEFFNGLIAYMEESLDWYK